MTGSTNPADSSGVKAQLIVTGFTTWVRFLKIYRILVYEKFNVIQLFKAEAVSVKGIITGYSLIFTTQFPNLTSY